MADGAHHPLVGAVDERRVDNVVDAPLPDAVERERREVDLRRGAGEVDDLHGGDELEEDDAEAVDVALVGEVEVLVVLRVEVPRRALRRRRDVRQRRLVEAADGAGEAEVGEPGAEVAVEEDVAGLDVAVEDGRPLGVQVGDRRRRLRRDAEPRAPWEPPTGEVVGERAVGDELVDEDLLAAV
ncbi:hypothetical protein EE612_060701 [Oryza sativa]|nr:hypothetical protein EE612_060701 [Oryza sativa]